MNDEAYCATNVSEESVSTQEPSEFLNLISVETTKRMPVIWDVDINNNRWIYGEKSSFLSFVSLGKYHSKSTKGKHNVGSDRTYTVLITLA